MVIKQNVANGHFYTKGGVDREIPPFTYTFKAIIEPCEVTLTDASNLSLMVMSIGDSGISQSYQVDQTPNCYTGVVTLEPDYSWITLDTSAKTITIP